MATFHTRCQIAYIHQNPQTQYRMKKSTGAASSHKYSNMLCSDEVSSDKVSSALHIFAAHRDKRNRREENVDMTFSLLTD